MNLLDPMHMVAALVYALVGLMIFGAAFICLDKITPYSLWEEIVKKQNNALATMLGMLSIGICIIISAAIVG